MSLISRFLVASEAPLSELQFEVPLDGKSLYMPCFVDLRPFGIPRAVAKYPVTNSIYSSYLNVASRKKLLYLGDERFNGLSHPAVGVTFKDAEEYCGWMSERFSAKFDLPDTKTWESAAKCGHAKDYSTPTGECTPEYANFGLRVGATTAVNKYPANEYGLHDMTGNVLEWTCSIPTVAEMRPEYGANPVKNAKDLGQNRILKGGSWAFDAANSRISATIILGVFSNYYTTGFRPVIHLD